MKKVIAALFSAYLIISLIFVSGAEDLTEKYREYMKEDRRVSVTEFLTGEREDSEEDYEEIDEFFASLPESLSDADIDRDLTGASEKYDLSYFFTLMVNGIKSALRRLFAPVMLLTALCIISFIVKTYTCSSSAGRAASVAVRCAVCLSVAAGGIIPIKAASGYLSDLSAVTEASIPACAALLVASGRIGGAATTVTYITLLSALFEKIFSGVVLPLIASAFALTLVECVYPGRSPVRISTFPLSVAKWLSVTTAAVSAFVFGIQSHLSASADSVGMKTLKMAIGSSIPLVGGSLGDTASMISAGASSVKSAFGATLLVIMLTLLITPLLSLAVGRLALSAASSLSGALGEDAEPFKSLSSVMAALIAAVASAGAIFMVVIVTFTSYGALI